MWPTVQIVCGSVLHKKFYLLLHASSKRGFLLLPFPTCANPNPVGVSCLLLLTALQNKIKHLQFYGALK